MKTLQDNQVKFVYYSIRERLAFQDLAKMIKLNVSEISDEDGYESWDVIFRTHKGQSCVSEIKVRRRASTEFDTWIFEKAKFDGLNQVVARAGGLKIKPVFIVFFTDCTLIWDVSEIKKDDFNTSVLRASSVDGNDTLTDKEVVYLKPSDATRIEYQVDMDKLNINAKTVFKFKYMNNNINLINL